MAEGHTVSHFFCRLIRSVESKCISSGRKSLLSPAQFRVTAEKNCTFTSSKNITYGIRLRHDPGFIQQNAFAYC